MKICPITGLSLEGMPLRKFHPSVTNAQYQKYHSALKTPKSTEPRICPISGLSLEGMHQLRKFHPSVTEAQYQEYWLVKTGRKKPREEPRFCPITGLSLEGFAANRRYHPSAQKERVSQWNKQNREKHKDDKKWNEMHAARQREYRARHGDQYREYIREYFKSRPIEVDGIEYLGYRKTPKNKAYMSEAISEYNTRMPKQILSAAEFEALYRFQDGRCAISGEIEEELHEDHCPISGQIRGLLCRNCNVGLGFARENPLLLRKLADVLENDTLKRNAQINRILGRFKTPEMLRRAADYLENPTYQQMKTRNNTPHTTEWMLDNRGPFVVKDEKTEQIEGGYNGKWWENNQREGEQ